MAVLVTPESLLLFRSLSCAKGAEISLSVCMRECVHACVKDRLLATATQVHMLGVLLCQTPWVTSDLTGTHTHNQRAASFMEIRAVSSMTS